MKHYHDEDMQSLSLRTSKALDPSKFMPWLQQLVATEGQKILRSKGILSFTGDDDVGEIRRGRVLCDGGNLRRMADIVRATYYITNAADADAIFAVCGENLGDVRPAATLLTVAGLYKPEMKIEIEVTAKRRTA